MASTSNSSQRAGGEQRFRKSRASVTSLARLLKEDSILINNIAEFEDNLGIVYPVDGSSHCGLSTYDRLIKILKVFECQKAREATVGKLITCLRKCRLNNSADKLESIYYLEAEISSIIQTEEKDYSADSERPIKFTKNIDKKLWWNATQSIVDFVGRATEIEAVMEIHRKQKGKQTQASISISGGPKIGKKMLAKHLGAKFYQEKNASVIYIDDLKRSVIGLGTHLGITTNIKDVELPAEEVFKEVLLHLISIGPVLVIIDGGSDIPADRVRSLVKVSSQLPPSDNQPLLLVITTVGNSVVEECLLDINLQNLNAVEAKELIRTLFKMRDHEESVEEFYKLTGGSPSEIKKALSLSSRHSDLSRGSGTDLEFCLLNIFAYFSENINGNFAFAMCQNLGVEVDKLRFLSAVNGFVGQGWGKATNNNENLLINSMMQQVVRINLKSLSSNNLKQGQTQDLRVTEIEILRKLLKGICSCYQSLPFSERTHLSNVWKFASQYDELVKEFAQVPFMIFRESGGSVTTNISVLEHNYNRLKDVLGFMNKHTLLTGYDYAEGLFLTKSQEKSLELFTNVYEGMKKVLGITDRKTLAAGHWRVWILFELMRYSELKDLHAELITACDAACLPKLSEGDRKTA